MDGLLIFKYFCFLLVFTCLRSNKTKKYGPHAPGSIRNLNKNPKTNTEQPSKGYIYTDNTPERVKFKVKGPLNPRYATYVFPNTTEEELQRDKDNPSATNAYDPDKTNEHVSPPTYKPHKPYNPFEYDGPLVQHTAWSFFDY